MIQFNNCNSWFYAYLWFPIKIQNIQGRQTSDSLMVYYTKKITLKLSLGTSYKNMQLSWIYFPPFFSNEFLKKYFWDWWSLWVIHMCVLFERYQKQLLNIFWIKLGKSLLGYQNDIVLKIFCLGTLGWAGGA